MKRLTTTVVLVAALALLAAAAGGFTRGTAQAGTSASVADATKLTVWVGWSAGTELKEFQALVAEYDKKNTGVEIKVVGGINDNKIIAALRSGNAPDVVSSFSSQNVGIYCPSGGWIDLGPLLKRDKIDTTSSRRRRATTPSTRGRAARCRSSRTSYGFYYNKTLFKQAGLTRPPKTFSELTAYAKKLTKKNADGTFKVVGYDPNPTFYHGGAGMSPYGTLVGAKYFTSDGKSSLAQGSVLGQTAQVAEGPDRLLRLRQARQVADRAPVTSSRRRTPSRPASSR